MPRRPVQWGVGVTAIGELTTLRRQPNKARVTPKPAERGDNRAAVFFLAPWFAGLFLITVGPMAASLYLSFTDYSLLDAPVWIGLDNFATMLGDERLLTALRVTFVYVFVSVPIQLAIALALALFLDRGLRGLPIYRSVFYLPSLLGGSVAIAIMWRQIFGNDGLINQFLSWFGIEGAGWIADPRFALGTLIVLNVWTFGSPMIIFLAGLRQVPAALYESAAIDGAGKFRQFRSITVPLLTPIIFFNLVLQIIYAFQAFTEAFVVSGGSGGPVDSTLFYTLYLYEEGFTHLNMGYASALAWLLLAIVGGLTAVNFFLSKYWVFYDD
jgi:multiple sugar transport system permease protein